MFGHYIFLFTHSQRFCKVPSQKLQISSFVWLFSGILQYHPKDLIYQSWKCFQQCGHSPVKCKEFILTQFLAAQLLFYICGFIMIFHIKKKVCGSNQQNNLTNQKREAQKDHVICSHHKVNSKTKPYLLSRLILYPWGDSWGSGAMHIFSGFIPCVYSFSSCPLSFILKSWVSERLSWVAYISYGSLHIPMGRKKKYCF